MIHSDFPGDSNLGWILTANSDNTVGSMNKSENVRLT